MTIAAPAPLYDAVLFDLDGTLVDPAGGITGGIEHALRAMDLPVPDASVLEGMIGPKLADALANRAGVPLPLVPETIAAYRSWYRSTGMAMSKVYPGIAELLAELRASGIRLGVATQKPEPLAKTLLAHHGLDAAFDVIRGANEDETLMPGDAGYRQGKQEIIAAALAELAADNAVMVGDRHQDVNGATANGLSCIGVSWGFAVEGELAEAGAAAVVDSTTELARHLAPAAREAANGTV
ncbi:HAD hydrolase-like protein [Arthrobacter sp. ERGS1:01]|uniref:HAD hydrolase-like protein n=1 Tax=Arthrobacter sp. ERGS1:01 TaxID=1704044 RepID=UPI0013649D94|nr:HAD hydrolase-like protein [Arthrobacter sp. ERGS1:01]